jgi:hypothetical protein
MYVFHELPGGFPLVHALLIDDVLLVLVRPMTPQGSMICSTLSDGSLGFNYSLRVPLVVVLLFLLYRRVLVAIHKQQGSDSSSTSST